MLRFERHVVATLAADLDPERRAGVTAYVDGALAALPELVRAGVAAESVVLGAWSGLQRALGRSDEEVLGTRLERLDRNPLAPVRQYSRLLRSLVLFAECELEPTP